MAIPVEQAIAALSTFSLEVSFLCWFVLCYLLSLSLCVWLPGFVSFLLPLVCFFSWNTCNDIALVQNHPSMNDSV